VPKSTKILSIIVLILAIYAGFALFKGDKTDTLAVEDAQFAIADSGTVTKIILKTNQNPELEFTKPFENWLINNSIQADDEKMFNLIQFVYKARVKRPVYKEKIEMSVNQLKSKGLKVNYMGEKGVLKSFWLGYFGGVEDELVAMMDGFQTPYIVQLPGFSGSLAQLFKPEIEAWKTRLIFSSKISYIENLKVSFNYYPKNSFEIEKMGNKHSVQDLPKADSMRLYSYLQLFEQVAIKEWIANFAKKDSLLNQNPAFEINLTDRNPKKSNNIMIYFDDKQKGNIYGLVGEKQDLCIIKPTIFEYLLQKRSFFEGKK